MLSFKETAAFIIILPQPASPHPFVDNGFATNRDQAALQVKWVELSPPNNASTIERRSKVRRGGVVHQEKMRPLTLET